MCEQKRNKRIQLIRSIVEHVIGRVKRFGILRHQCRSNRAYHGMFFKVACALTNVDFGDCPMRTTLHPPLRPWPHRKMQF